MRFSILRTHTLPLFVGLALLFGAAAAHAQSTDPTRAAAHASEGQKALQSRDHHRALTEYALALAYEPSAQRVADLGSVYEAMGNRPVAMELYQRASALDPGGSAGGFARQRLVALGGNTTPTAATGSTVQLTVMPPGAEIYVDGTLKGRAPLPAIAVSPGSHRIEVRLAGYKNWIQTLQVPLGKPISQVVTLMPGTTTPAQTGTGTAGTGTGGTTVAAGTNMGNSASSTVRIEGIPGRATVTIDGQGVPVSGTTVVARVPQGTHTLVVTAPRMAPWQHTVTVAAGQTAVVQVPSAGASAPTVAPSAGSIAGAWFGTPLEGSRDLAVRRSSVMDLDANLNGKLTMTSNVALANWKQKQCGGRATATWSTEYSVRAVKTGAGIKLVAASGRQTACDCDGMCPTDSSLDLDLLVASDNAVMVGAEMLFQRRTGSDVPANALKSSVEVSGLGGAWTLAVGDPADNITGAATLTASGNVRGTVVHERTTEIARWRAKECGGNTDVAATYEFSVEGEVDGAALDLSFGSKKITKCSCTPAACAAAGATVGLPSAKARMTLDGKHLVAPNFILTRK